MDMYVYIDESGDNGTGGHGTRWLVFGAAMVMQAFLPVVEMELADIFAMASQGRPIHFHKLSQAKRVGIYQRLADWPYWDGSVVASDTAGGLQRPGGLARADYQYNFPLRHAVERASWYAAAHQEMAEVIIEHREGTFVLADFKNYLRLVKAGHTYPTTVDRMNWDHLNIDSIRTGTRESDPMLCIADGLAYAAGQALNRSRPWNVMDTSFLMRIKPRLWKGETGGVATNTFTTLPTELRTSVETEYPWLKELE